MNTSAHRTKKRTERTHSLPAVCGCGLLLFIGACLVLLIIAALIAYSRSDPGKASVPAALSALYLSAILGGAAAGRMWDSPLTAGGIYGAACVLLTLLLSALPLGDATCDLGVLPSILARLGIAAAGVLGAWIFRKRHKRAVSKKKQATPLTFEILEK